jgi:hypothetical protein
MLEDYVGGRIYDMITREPAVRGEKILDTGIKSGSYNPIRNNRTMYIKESTIVWLAEKAGYALVKRDAGDSGNTEDVDAGDAESGNGEAEVGEVKAGGSTKPAGRSSRTTKSK